ncbi:MinD/ParA family protein [Litchfieldia salsa]|uniref:Flagellar biosynthesis protein FlhG n=1 Tax=Litchfieldia salsa TaxID=930152 RepID=A0A1H0R796_9BACI|nr:MinD/ParA family protein [Litchfieldia salsa]SDP24926.1 flagellar biosynthesis protein FlhG [Litchfieldia salsa]
MTDQAQNLRNQLKSIEKKKTKTIAVISGKGGVGKSNFSLNFSLALSQSGQKVLLFDMDIGMGNIDILMGVSSPYSFIDLFERDLSIRDIIKSVPDQLSYISGGTGLSSLFNLDKEKFNYFVNQMHDIMPEYNYLIFDMGAGISEENLQFLLTVDEIFVITTPEPTSITDAYSAMKHICSYTKDIPFFLIVNKAQNEKEGIATIERIDHAVKHFLYKETIKLGSIPDDKNVVKAVKHQVPVLIYSPKSSVSRSIEEIVRTYTSQTPTGTIVKEHTPFISKLRQLISKR